MWFKEKPCKSPKLKYPYATQGMRKAFGRVFGTPAESAVMFCRQERRAVLSRNPRLCSVHRSDRQSMNSMTCAEQTAKLVDMSGIS